MKIKNIDIANLQSTGALNKLWNCRLPGSFAFKFRLFVNKMKEYLEAYTDARNKIAEEFREAKKTVKQTVPENQGGQELDVVKPEHIKQWNKRMTELHDGETDIPFDKFEFPIAFIPNGKLNEESWFSPAQLDVLCSVIDFVEPDDGSKPKTQGKSKKKSRK